MHTNSSLVTFWKKLKTVHHVALHCTDHSHWHGSAQVSITLDEDKAILFHEKGEWERLNISFTNIFRWRLHPKKISLEHLRFGSQFPVSLVEFTSITKNALISIHPHLCGQDQYSARIFWNLEGIHLYWEIQGPMKKQRIYSHYR